jgi:hypothetical protein
VQEVHAPRLGVVLSFTHHDIPMDADAEGDPVDHEPDVLPIDRVHNRWPQAAPLVVEGGNLIMGNSWHRHL